MLGQARVDDRLVGSELAVPVVVRLRAGTAAAEVAAGADGSTRLLGPYGKAPAATDAPGCRPGERAAQA